MARPAFTPATSEQVERLAAALVASHLFVDRDDVRETQRTRPWRILVAGRDVAVVDRWRDHLDILSIEALWCADRAVAHAVAELRGLAAGLGLHDVVSPPVPADQAYLYEAAGMHVAEWGSVWRLELGSRRVRGLPGPHDVAVRSGSLEDLDAVMRVDAASFGEFWRYDRRRLERLVRAQRLALAERSGEAIGYTLTTAERDGAQLGRLCVVPSSRRFGVGRLLLADAVFAAARAGAAHMTLFTQTDNRPARSLYRGLGFADSGERLAFLRFG